MYHIIVANEKLGCAISVVLEVRNVTSLENSLKKFLLINSCNIILFSLIFERKNSIGRASRQGRSIFAFENFHFLNTIISRLAKAKGSLSLSVNG